MLTAEEYLYSFERFGFIREQTSRGVRYRLPPHLGEGGFELLGDLETCYACITDVIYKKPCVVREAVAEKMLEFGFYSMGSASYYQKRSQIYPFDHGLNYWVNYPYLTGYKRMDAGHRMLNSGLCYRERFFDELAGRLPADFWETAAEVLNPDVIKLPQVTLICEQIRNCRLSGTELELYIQGKGYEAFALTLEYINAHKKKPALRLSIDDRASLEQVAVELQRGMRQPPSIQSIARTAGMGQQKLMTGFRQLYGTTIYGYLKRLRMERAAELLCETVMPVTEIAREVGYHGDGHFQQAFREAYGTTPGKFRRELWETGTKTAIYGQRT